MADMIDYADVAVTSDRYKIDRHFFRLFRAELIAIKDRNMQAQNQQVSGYRMRSLLRMSKVDVVITSGHG